MVRARDHRESRHDAEGEGHHGAVGLGRFLAAQRHTLEALELAHKLPGLNEADLETHVLRFGWWFGGGSNPELPPFGPLVEAARASRLEAYAC